MENEFDCNMIIYAIRNKVNNKYYIGQSINNFKTRYKGNKQWHNPRNQLVRNAYKKYGKDNFEIIFLEKNVESLDKLNEFEKFYAKKYNSYAPNGYNLKECGDSKGKWNEISIEKIVKNYVFINPMGQEIHTKNLDRFCKNNNLDKCHMYKLAKGQRFSHKGWKCKNLENKIYTFVNQKSGEILKFNSHPRRYGIIKDMCEKLNLCDVAIYRILNGITKVSRKTGWYLKSVETL